MAIKGNWTELSHPEKVQLFKKYNNQEIIDYYLPAGTNPDEFRQQLEAEIAFWDAKNLGDAKTAGKPPTKEATIGAWRDLNRAEALLELIDNSIDVWTRRRAKYPSETAPRLQIYIDLEKESDILTYEDNAGGVPEDKLENLVVPGYSDTADPEFTIGSYRTGGKKAIFKLASEVNIRTRYWDPVGSSRKEFQVHLDKVWLEDPDLYPFQYYPVASPILGPGQTTFSFKLRDGAVEGPGKWDLDVIKQITREIRRTYTLLLLRHPEIQIHFLDRANSITPLEDLYKFTGAHNGKKLDLRPQRAIFKLSLPWQGIPHDVRIEIVMGCRTTLSVEPGTDQPGNDIWGIDFYGNDRLFVLNEQDYVLDWFGLPKGNSRQYIRGFINIHGPNVFVPWDTHKRHLNIDREIVTFLRKDGLIKEFFLHWADAYQKVVRLKEVRQHLKPELKPWKVANDLNIPNSSKTEIIIQAQGKRRGVHLPASIHKPIVPTKVAAATDIEIKFKVTKAEFRSLCSKFELPFEPDDRGIKAQLGEEIKNNILE